MSGPSGNHAAPWQQRFHVPVVRTAQFATGARTRGMMVTNGLGRWQLSTWDVPTGDFTQLTARPDGTAAGLITPDGRYVCYMDDRQGNERGHLVRVPFGSGAPQDLTPALPPCTCWSYAASQDGRVIGLCPALPDGFALYTVTIGPDGALGAPRRLYHSARLLPGPAFSFRGEIAVLATVERSVTPRSGLIALDADGTPIGELWDGLQSSLETVAFSPCVGDDRLLATTDRSGVTRPLLWNPGTGERTDLALPELAGDVVPLDWSPDGGRLLLRQTSPAAQRLHSYDLASRTLRRLDHPGGTIDTAFFGPADDILALWQDATHRPRVSALDASTGRQVGTPLGVDTTLSSRPWRSVSLTSIDGQLIQAWLALPTGAGPFPAVIDLHGGPHWVMTERFSPEAQLWLDHGFAYLSVNYRGSTTFGRRFQEQIWGDPGHWEVEDTVAARDWLLRQGMARPDFVFLYGWSYGAYVSLLALGQRPELWAAAMVGAAVADRSLQYKDGSDWQKAWLTALHGGTPQEKPDLYRVVSPITFAELVCAPVFIAQGRQTTEHRLSRWRPTKRA